MNGTANGIIVWEIVTEWHERPDLMVNSNDDWLAYDLKKLLIGVDEPHGSVHDAVRRREQGPEEELALAN